MEFSQQEYSNGEPFHSPGVLPDPGIRPGSSALQVNFLLSEAPGKPQEADPVAQICKDFVLPVRYRLEIGQNVKNLLRIF